jgi:hypothetical protein
MKNMAVNAVRDAVGRLENVQSVATPIEFHIATNVILETGFTNLQFVGLASLAHEAGDYLVEKMVTSIQMDEGCHAQIVHPCAHW